MADDPTPLVPLEVRSAAAVLTADPAQGGDEVVVLGDRSLPFNRPKT